MDGRAVFRHAVARMGEASRAATTAAGWEVEQVDRLVPDQANARITAFVAHRSSDQTSMPTPGSSPA